MMTSVCLSVSGHRNKCSDGSKQLQNSNKLNGAELWFILLQNIEILKNNLNQYLFIFNFNTVLVQ